VSLFPQNDREALHIGVVGRAFGARYLSGRLLDPRDYTTDPHRTVDDRPYGADGDGLKVEPVRSAVRDALKVLPAGQPARLLGRGRMQIRAEAGRARRVMARPCFGADATRDRRALHRTGNR